MLTPERAAAAVRASNISNREKGELLAFVGGELKDDDDDDTIVAYLQAKAKGASAGAGGATTELLNTILANQEKYSQLILANHNFMWGIMLAELKRTLAPPSSGKESRGSNAPFRKDLVAFYGVSVTPSVMRCMVLDKDLPSRFLVAGHLFAVRWTRYASIMMGKDFRVDSPKNGIIWNSAIEHAYERQRICFSYSGLGSEFILHVLDKSLLEKKLSAVGQHKTDPDFVQALGDDTFESLQGKRVNFTGAEGKGPFKRALALHAKLALENCAKIYPADFDPRKFNFDDMSEHEGKEELIKLWLDELDTGSVAESGLNEAAAASADPEEAVNEEAVAEGP